MYFISFTNFLVFHIICAFFSYIFADKVDENYLYSWYKTLYTLFHSAGFRLYHTSATSPLCLQVTMMESCRYFMSWVQNPGPRKYVLYPPAMDGVYFVQLYCFTQYCYYTLCVTSCHLTWHCCKTRSNMMKLYWNQSQQAFYMVVL